MTLLKETSAAIDAAIGEVWDGRISPDELIALAALLAILRTRGAIGLSVGNVHFPEQNGAFTNLAAALDALHRGARRNLDPIRKEIEP